MSILSLIYKEIIHRKFNVLLSLLAVMVAVALFISFFTAGKASSRETARLMLSMGFNLHIVPKGTDMNEFLLTGLTNKTMPEEYLEKLGSQKGFSYNHLLAILQRKISWRGMEVILTGLAPEVCLPGLKKPPMVNPIEPGTAYVGYVLADKLGLKKGDNIEIRSKTLKIAKCLFEQGGVDDIRIQCHLIDAQEILKLNDQISEIQAVDCLCFVPTNDPVAILRKEIASVLPETQVFQMRPIAMARAQQRQMVRNVFAVIMPFVVVVCGAWIGVLAMMNVRDRQQEIGIMRALGYGSGKVTAMFLGKAAIIGLVGAILGFVIGTALALNFGPDIFKITANTTIKPELFLLIQSLIFAPVFAAVSGFIPTMIAVTYDPAVTLREE
ncbi:MAG: ABC transporter permease [Planctomycetota bacterium]|jgi:ABC-type lipoprotein release transport system permease subunit